jgi:hypothetical protein
MSDLGAVVAAYINNLHDMAQRGRNFGYNLELQRQANEAAMNRAIATAMSALQKQREQSIAQVLSTYGGAISKGEVDPTVTAAVLNAIKGQGLLDEGSYQFLQEALAKSEESRQRLANSMANIVAGISAAKGEPLPPETVDNMRLGFSVMTSAGMGKAFASMVQRGTTVNVGPQKTPESIMALEGAKQSAISGIKSLDKEIEDIYNTYNSMVESAKMLGDENIVKEMSPESLRRIMESYQKGFRGLEAIQRAMETFTSDEDRAIADMLLNAAKAINLMQAVPGMKGQMSNYEDRMFEGFGTGRFNTADGLTAFILTAKARSAQMKKLYEAANDIDNLRQKMSFGRYSAEQLDLLQSELRDKIDYFHELKKKPPYEFLTGKQQEFLKNFYGRLNEGETKQSKQQEEQGQPTQPTGKNLINDENFQSHANEFVSLVTGVNDIGKAKKEFLSSIPPVVTTKNKSIQEIIGGDSVNLRDFMLSEEIPDERKIKLLAIILKNLYNQKVPANKRKPYTSRDYEALADYWLNFLIASFAKSPKHGK